MLVFTVLNYFFLRHRRTPLIINTPPQCPHMHLHDPKAAEGCVGDRHCAALADGKCLAYHSYEAIALVSAIRTHLFELCSIAVFGL